MFPYIPFIFPYALLYKTFEKPLSCERQAPLGACRELKFSEHFPHSCHILHAWNCFGTVLKFVWTLLGRFWELWGNGFGTLLVLLQYLFWACSGRAFHVCFLCLPFEEIILLLIIILFVGSRQAH